jgi:uncharacterized protein (DUF1501 family)
MPSRRAFLRAGGLGYCGLTLPAILRAEEAAGIRGSRKSVINIHLDGGPPQMDMIDLKPDSPAEVRGEFRPIPTAITGFQICELMPKTARLANDFAFIRALVGAANKHDAFQCQSGFSEQSLKPIGGRPAMGCVLNHLLSESTDTSPAFVDLMLGRPLVRNSARPGFLGPAAQAFRPDISKQFSRPLEEAMKGELRNQGADHATSLALNASLDAQRLSTRAGLLTGLDRLRRDVDASGLMDAMDRFNQQAAGILLSGKFAEAMDLSKEHSRTLDYYTAPATGTAPSATSENEYSMRKFLLARRLIEAGVRCVSVSFSDFDTHSKNYPRLRHLLPVLDHGLWALVTDLKQRGMLDDVSIVIWGEFGRTPTINSQGGRDHWPAVGMAMLAGGGMRTGQVIGATDRMAATAIERPIHYQDVFATLYRNLGIDALRTTIADPSGRPQYLLDRGSVIAELV